jgi:hypothetical protein
VVLPTCFQSGSASNTVTPHPLQLSRCPRLPRETSQSKLLHQAVTAIVPRTTKPYDRREDDASLDECEKVGI